jgi:hypothetical protein
MADDTNAIDANAIDANAMDEILDTNWLEDFKQNENKYNMFYKEPVIAINIFSIYVSRENEITHIHKDKCALAEKGILNRDIIIALIKQHQKLAETKYKIISLLKYNIDINPTDINDNIDDNIDDNRFITSEKYLNDIHYKETISMFKDLNALYLIFYEEKKTLNQNCTKRVNLSSVNLSSVNLSSVNLSSIDKKKTRRNKIKKNLKIIKQIS